MIELIQRGGIIMIPLLLCSLTAVAVAVERWLYLRHARSDSDKLMNKVRAALERSSTQEARGICEATSGPVARILSILLADFHLPKDELRQLAKEAALAELPAMEGQLTLLETMTRVAPLLGLLGTIWGLIKVFNVIGGGAIGDVTKLSSGIGDALICTFTGLCIAIPSLVAYNLLARRVDNLVNEVELRVAELLNLQAGVGVEA